MQEAFFLVLGLAGLLFIASVLLPLANRLNFPYTVLLAVAGSGLGAIVLTVGEVEGLWIIGDFLNALDELDITSEAVFFVFLPALIFESALNISARHLMEDIGPILLLAILGLMISTLVVGTSVWAISGFGLIVCLLLGVIVSATDPVAVVALFKDLGAPTRLTILVEGESLFNDATAIVLFTILAGILTGTAEAGLLGATGDFIRVFLGGILVGMAIAWVTVLIIGRLRNMPLIEITLTVCLAYFAFLFAEHYLHVSGVMAVVSAGLIARSYGRTMVSPATWHALMETWEQLGFWANSLIFFLVGLLVPRLLIDFTTKDAVTLAVLIVAAFGARAVVLYGVLPLMNRFGLGQKVSLAFRTVMLWGGLRGAVSLALALVILESPNLPPEIQQFIVVLVTGFVLFTLFVNAPTIRLIMKFFDLDKLPTVDLAIRNRIMALSLSHIREDLEQTAQEYKIDPAIAHDVATDYEKRLAEIEQEIARAEKIPDKELRRIGLSTLTNHERHLYLERFTQGLISARIARILVVKTDDLQDAVKTGGIEGYKQAVDESLGFNNLFRIAMALHQRFNWTGPLGAQLANRFAVLRATQAVIRDLISYNREKMPALLGDSVTQELEALLNERFENTWQALHALRLQFPDYATTVQKRHLGRVAVRLEDADYRQMLKDQVISQEVFNDLERDLDRRARSLARQPQLDLGLDPDELVAKVPFFADLDGGRIKEVAKLLKPRLAVPGERIVRKGKTGNAMYFISTGVVEIKTEPEPIRLGGGDFFGEIALLTRQPRSADVVAVSYCELLVLYERDFHKLLDAHPRLRETVTRTARERASLINGKLDHHHLQGL